MSTQPGQMGERQEFVYELQPDEAPTDGVVRATSIVSGRPAVLDGPSNDGRSASPLDPLYAAVDPDALDSLYVHARRHGDAAATVQFTYCGFRVTVDSSGTVVVGDP